MSSELLRSFVFAAAGVLSALILAGAITHSAKRYQLVEYNDRSQDGNTRINFVIFDTATGKLEMCFYSRRKSVDPEYDKALDEVLKNFPDEGCAAIRKG